MREQSDQSRPRGRTLSLRARILIGALLVVGGAAVLALIFTTEPVALRETQTRQTAMLVEVTQAERGDFRPTIQALGTVIAAREITLTPRVSGEVTELAEAFDPGGFVSRGEVMVRIDDADYRNLLAQRESELQQAIATLEMERGASAKAEQDYRQLNKEVPEDRKALILREPQLRSAEAVVQSARAAVEQARLDLQRTIISAPFDAHVLSREVSVGSQVSASDPLARLAGVDRYWIETTIPPEKLRWLTFPDNGAQDGSRVSIRQRTAWNADQFRSGTLYRLIGELEGNTRLARALVAVDDPLARNTEDPDVPALMIGTYVECLIEGREIRDAFRLRREFVRNDDKVWLMRGGVLAIQPVDVVFRDAEYAYIQDGIEAGDQVVITSLATVKEGVPLRLNQGPSQ